MTKAKISEYSATAGDNTDVNGVNIAEGCPPSSMNNMGREIMAALKRYQVGSDGDGVTVGGNLVVSGTATVTSGSINGTTVGATTASTGSFTTLNTSGQVVFNDAGADVDFRVEGDTDANLLFVDASTDRVGIGTSSPGAKLDVVESVFANIPRFTRTTTGVEDGSISSQRVKSTTTQNMVDGFGTSIQFAIQDSANVENDIASVGAVRSGADNSGSLTFSTANAGTSAERARITSDGFLRMASGTGGIQFNGDTAAANALDDYEQGTWTPTYLASTTNPTVTYQAQNGQYVKIGEFVFFSLELETSAVSGGGGGLRIGNLPFTTANARFPGGGVATLATQFTNNSPDAGYAGQNVTHINLTHHSSATSSVENNNSDLTNGVSKNFLIFTGSYRSA